MSQSILKFECKGCHRVNYHQTRSRKSAKTGGARERLVRSKFCKHCKKHVEHKETK